MAAVLCYPVVMPEEIKRVPSTFKLTERARALLEALARDRGVNLTGLLEVLIREEAERRGVEVSSNPSK